MSRLRAGWWAFAVVSVLLGLCFAPASAVVVQTVNVVARDPHGVVLPDDPLLQPGERVSLTITGFGPQAHVTVRLGTSPLGSFIADSSGRVQFTFVVPANFPAGQYVVAAVGSALIHPYTPTPVSGQGTIDPQLFEAEVPTLGLFPFHIGPVHQSSSPTRPPTSPTHPSTPHSSGSPGNAGGLGHTGVDVALLLFIGAVGLIGGLLIMMPGRRRKHA